MAKMNRRQFLNTTSAAALLASTPGLAHSQMIGSYGPFGDYKALVCVFLFGGNDSFNMLVPTSPGEYAAYQASRQNLAIPSEQLLDINPVTGAENMSFGVHPAMTGIRDMFESGQGAFIANVGPLVEPTTRDQFLNGSVAIPPQLFSHNDQQDQWHSLKGNATSKTGWAGRVADLISGGVTGQQMATNASLFGTSLFQSAEETVAYVMGPTGPVPFLGFSSDPDDILYQQRLTVERIVNAQYGTVYERGFADVQRRAIAAADSVSAAIEDETTNTAFPASQLGSQLETVARLILAQDDLQMERQVFFVAAGGFDSHDNQNQDQPGLLGGISDAISAFQAEMASQNLAQDVTVFTASDFGRTLTSNGDGTDHAWGGHAFVAGGAVAGQAIYGDYPVPEIGGPLDVGGGRFIPTTSADQYAATLARWFGIDDADLDVVAPNLVNFGANRDLGFML
jgi:uncharacterized protein (DUF1501 family)